MGGAQRSAAARRFRLPAAASIDCPYGWRMLTLSPQERYSLYVSGRPERQLTGGANGLSPAVRFWPFDGPRARRWQEAARLTWVRPVYVTPRGDIVLPSCPATVRRGRAKIIAESTTEPGPIVSPRPRVGVRSAPRYVLTYSRPWVAGHTSGWSAPSPSSCVGLGQFMYLHKTHVSSMLSAPTLRKSSLTEHVAWVPGTVREGAA